jgi:hypothetical protein
MVLVAGVAVPVVQVVHVVAVLDLLVPAPGTVHVGVLLGRYVHVQDALVVVLTVCPVGVPVVQVVHVVAVLHLGMPTTGAMRMLMFMHRVRRVIGSGGHRRSSLNVPCSAECPVFLGYDMRKLSPPQRNV